MVVALKRELSLDEEQYLTGTCLYSLKSQEAVRI